MGTSNANFPGFTPSSSSSPLPVPQKEAEKQSSPTAQTADKVGAVIAHLIKNLEETYNRIPKMSRNDAERMDKAGTYPEEGSDEYLSFIKTAFAGEKKQQVRKQIFQQMAEHFVRSWSENRRSAPVPKSNDEISSLAFKVLEECKRKPINIKNLSTEACTKLGSLMMEELFKYKKASYSNAFFDGLMGWKMGTTQNPSNPPASEVSVERKQEARPTTESRLVEAIATQLKSDIEQLNKLIAELKNENSKKEEDIDNPKVSRLNEQIKVLRTKIKQDSSVDAISQEAKRQVIDALSSSLKAQHDTKYEALKKEFAEKVAKFHEVQSKIIQLRKEIAEQEEKMQGDQANETALKTQYAKQIHDMRELKQSLKKLSKELSDMKKEIVDITMPQEHEDVLTIAAKKHVEELVKEKLKEFEYRISGDADIVILAGHDSLTRMQTPVTTRRMTVGTVLSDRSSNDSLRGKLDTSVKTHVGGKPLVTSGIQLRDLPSEPSYDQLIEAGYLALKRALYHGQESILPWQSSEITFVMEQWMQFMQTRPIPSPGTETNTLRNDFKQSIREKNNVQLQVTEEEFDDLLFHSFRYPKLREPWAFRSALNKIRAEGWRPGEEKTITFKRFPDEDFDKLNEALDLFFEHPYFMQFLEKGPSTPPK